MSLVLALAVKHLPYAWLPGEDRAANRFCCDIVVFNYQELIYFNASDVTYRICEHYEHCTELVTNTPPCLMMLQRVSIQRMNGGCTFRQ